MRWAAANVWIGGEGRAFLHGMATIYIPCRIGDTLRGGKSGHSRKRGEEQRSSQQGMVNSPPDRPSVKGRNRGRRRKVLRSKRRRYKWSKRRLRREKGGPISRGGGAGRAFHYFTLEEMGPIEDARWDEGGNISKKAMQGEGPEFAR